MLEAPNEFVTVGVQQTYYSNPQSSLYDTSYASSTPSGKPIAFSPVALNVRVSPSAKVDANTRLEYDAPGGPMWRAAANEVQLVLSAKK